MNGLLRNALSGFSCRIVAAVSPEITMMFVFGRSLRVTGSRRDEARGRGKLGRDFFDSFIVEFEAIVRASKEEPVLVL